MYRPGAEVSFSEGPKCPKGTEVVGAEVSSHRVSYGTEGRGGKGRQASGQTGRLFSIACMLMLE